MFALATCINAREHAQGIAVFPGVVDLCAVFHQVFDERQVSVPGRDRESGCSRARGTIDVGAVLYQVPDDIEVAPDGGHAQWCMVEEQRALRIDVGAQLDEPLYLVQAAVRRRRRDQPADMVPQGNDLSSLFLKTSRDAALPCALARSLF